jgi:hypothetical protein
MGLCLKWNLYVVEHFELYHNVVVDERFTITNCKLMDNSSQFHFNAFQFSSTNNREREEMRKKSLFNCSNSFFLRNFQLIYYTKIHLNSIPIWWNDFTLSLLTPWTAQFKFSTINHFIIKSTNYDFNRRRFLFNDDFNSIAIV